MPSLEIFSNLSDYSRLNSQFHPFYWFPLQDFYFLFETNFHSVIFSSVLTDCILFSVPHSQIWDELIHWFDLKSFFIALLSFLIFVEGHQKFYGFLLQEWRCFIASGFLLWRTLISLIRVIDFFRFLLQSARWGYW